MSKPLPQSEATRILPPGDVAEPFKARTEHTLSCGALQPIPTIYEFIEDSGIRFVVRVVDNLACKAAARQPQGRQSHVSATRANPFLPDDDALFVTDVSATHVGLLNKYNVMDHHLLIVTRAFEAQEELLNARDFEALCRCLLEVDELAFYNVGAAAGATSVTNICNWCRFLWHTRTSRTHSRCHRVGKAPVSVSSCRVASRCRAMG